MTKIQYVTSFKEEVCRKVGCKCVDCAFRKLSVGARPKYCWNEDCFDCSPTLSGRLPIKKHHGICKYTNGDDERGAVVKCKYRSRK